MHYVAAAKCIAICRDAQVWPYSLSTSLCRQPGSLHASASSAKNLNALDFSIISSVLCVYSGVHCLRCASSQRSTMPPNSRFRLADVAPAKQRSNPGNAIVSLDHNATIKEALHVRVIKCICQGLCFTHTSSRGRAHVSSCGLCCS
jgi:hypothetical protein